MRVRRSPGTPAAKSARTGVTDDASSPFEWLRFWTASVAALGLVAAVIRTGVA